MCQHNVLTHWGRVTHICVSKLTIIGSDNGLTPGRRQAIIRTNAGILLIGPLGTNVSEISIGIQTFSFSKMHLKMSSAKWRLFGLGLNELTHVWHVPLFTFQGGRYVDQCLRTKLYMQHGPTHIIRGLYVLFSCGFVIPRRRRAWLGIIMLHYQITLTYIPRSNVCG